MRVLHVLNSLEGGATVSARELVRASVAARSGVRHYAVFPGAPDSPGRGLEMFEGARPVPLAQWNRPGNMGALRTLAVGLLGARRRVAGPSGVSAIVRAIGDWKIDLVTTNCAANLQGALAARRARVSHLWHIRERIGSDGSLRYRIGDRRLARRISDLSTCVAAVSRYAAEPFTRTGIRTGVRIVYDGVDTTAFGTPQAVRRGRELRSKWMQNEEGVLVGAVANVTAQVKRHDLLLRAAALLAAADPKVRFVIVGKIPSAGGWFARPDLERWKRLRALAAELGLSGRLLWTGELDEIPATMEAMDIFVHACEIEGLGRVVLEAMAASRPVVAPAAGGVAEAVVDGITGILVEPRSAPALADGVRTLIDNRELRSRMGAAGRTRVLRRFTQEHHLAIMLDLYRRCAGETTVDRAGTPVGEEAETPC